MNCRFPLIDEEESQKIYNRLRAQMDDDAEKGTVGRRKGAALQDPI